MNALHLIVRGHHNAFCISIHQTCGTLAAHKAIEDATDKAMTAMSQSDLVTAIQNLAMGLRDNESQGFSDQ